MTKKDEEKLFILEDKIQKLEVGMVTAMGEVRSDIKLMTTEIQRLSETVEKMSDNYVTKEAHAKDMAALEQQMKEARKAGKVRSVLVGLLTTIITSVTVVEIMQIIN